MPQSIQLTIVDGVRIVVPDSLNLITPYVLREQNDWFEDEIKFLRRLLRPGQRIIDIGANHGVYTLPMAKVVGPTGAVWAFEPASRTAALLAAGIAANEFDQIVLEQSAISKECGTARLALNDNSELNALMQSDQAAAPSSETVAVVTLDDCLRRYGWTDIDFMKIDAEGEEANILTGGGIFFSKLSPLIQYEVKAGNDLHLQLVAAFAKLGFDSYRLVPGLDLLASFKADETPDGYLLNLFCCKRSRAAQLAADGFLVDPAFNDFPKAEQRVRELCQPHNRQYTWQSTVAQMPYGTRLAGLWEDTGDDGRVVRDAMSCYAISRDVKCTAVERFCALEASFNKLKGLCQSRPRYLRLASLARVARDYGARSNAVSALGQLATGILRTQQVELTEPFLAPSERFDSVPSGDEVGNWVLASTLEQLERLESFSSFFTGNAARRRLEMIEASGFGSAEMARRLLLLRTRFGGEPNLSPTAGR